jgi:NAD(P)-dependent dehydrogenase (short-subunit alcohol dehydrogenase family)
MPSLTRLSLDPRRKADHSRKDTSMTVTEPTIDSRTQTPRLLEGKVTIVTGASRGIGAAAARLFANAGATVVLAARDEQALTSLAGEIISNGGDALAVPTDVSDPGSVERLVRQAVKAAGRIDAAFNNAGAGHQPVPLAELAVEDFDQALAVNARGVFLAMKHEIAAMVDSGGGAIVNMTSTAGLRGVKASPATTPANTRSSGSPRPPRSTTPTGASGSTRSHRARSQATGSRSSRSRLAPRSPPLSRSDASASPTRSPPLSPGCSPTRPRSSPAP